MVNLKICFKCVRISFSRFLGSRNSYLIFSVTLLFLCYMFLPLVKVAHQYQGTLPPAAFAFYLSFPHLLMMQGGVTVLLFSDALTADEYRLWTVSRSGRLNYMVGHILYVFFMSAIYIFILYTGAQVIMLSAVGSMEKWGKILKTLSINGNIIQEAGINLPLGVSEAVVNSLSPAKALWYSILFFWLVLTFMGALQMFLYECFNRSAAMIVSGILIMMTIFTAFTGQNIIGRWLYKISPISWAYIGNLDWYKTGMLPSPGYAAGFLGVGIVVFSIVTCMLFRRKDI